MVHLENDGLSCRKCRSLDNTLGVLENPWTACDWETVGCPGQMGWRTRGNGFHSITQNFPIRNLTFPILSYKCSFFLSLSFSFVPSSPSFQFFSLSLSVTLSSENNKWWKFLCVFFLPPSPRFSSRMLFETFGLVILKMKKDLIHMSMRKWKATIVGMMGNPGKIFGYLCLYKGHFIKFCYYWKIRCVRVLI